MSPLMAAAKRLRHLRFWFVAALMVVDTASLSAAIHGGYGFNSA